MTKDRRRAVKLITAIGLFIFLYGAGALAPLWVNPCAPTHLSEQEIRQFREQYGSKSITLEEQAKNDQRYREEEIPCGAQDLPVFEKLEAARFQGMILGELESSRWMVLRAEFVGMVENTDLYHYKGYTFFFIPVLDAVGGGSGYMEIIPYPFLHRKLTWWNN